MSVNCMGGWCNKREHCVHYEPRPQCIPIERLCELGKTDCYQPVPIYWKPKEIA
jgi:hypothetical protein